MFVPSSISLTEAAPSRISRYLEVTLFAYNANTVNVVSEIGSISRWSDLASDFTGSGGVG